MDPFTGLGSTAVACARLGVNFIGSDIDETYLKEAVQRTARSRTSARCRNAEARGCGSEPARCFLRVRHGGRRGLEHEVFGPREHVQALRSGDLDLRRRCDGSGLLE